jgi:ATP-dependent protease ClpP protease subunit
MPNKLLSLVKNSKGHPFEIKNKSATKAEIVIYAPIGQSFWEESISASQFSEELKKLDSSVNEITVRINSPGGDVFDGIAIYNRLKQHKAKKIVYIDGLAASIASIIALAGDEIIMGEGALYMVHLPWTFAMGNRKDLDTTINRLLDIEEQLISIYAKKTKKERSEIRRMLEDETWMDSTTALEEGFVDKKSDTESLPIAASVFDKAQWINKAPKNFKNRASLVKNEIKDLRNKIEGVLARKK